MTEPHELPSLDALQQKIDASRKVGRAVSRKEKDASLDAGSAMAMRCAADLIAGVVVGGAIGYTLDKAFDSLPFASLVCLGFGVAGGFLNIWRTSQRALELDEVASKKKHDA